MITTSHLVKSFGTIRALDDLTITISDGQVFGLLGTNGAGKSTFLRLAAGIYRPDAGSVTIDGREVYDNVSVKKDLFFIADDPYYFPNSCAEDMRSYYAGIYPHFDSNRFSRLLDDFGLDKKRRILGYSKGMRKQLAVICGLCASTRYLLCDETFDGLDPVMRQAVKSLFANDIDARGLTPIIASHNLRELEDICEHVGLLHRGGLLLSEDLETLKLGIRKLQCVFKNEADSKKALSGLTVIRDDVRGRLHTIVIRGSEEEVLAHFEGIETIFFEHIPLTLEEIFICETEVAGYDVKKLVLG